jgi:thiol peroxidase
MQNTTNFTNFKGTKVELEGNFLEVGDDAPVVIGTGTDLSDVEFGGTGDKVQLIVAVPSLDTATCATETKRFNQDVEDLAIVDTFVVSMDLPFASQRFCSTEGISNLAVISDYVDKSFAKAYGILMKDNKLKGLCARAIFVIDKNGKIAYKEIVPEVTEEPNYEAVLDAIKGA